MAHIIRWWIADRLIMRALRICPADARGLALEDNLQNWWALHGVRYTPAQRDSTGESA